MKDMSPAEYRQFMMDQPRIGKLASVRPDGRPHVTPIWYIMDDDNMRFTVWHTTVKAANFAADNRVCLCVDDEKPPYAFVIIQGTVEVEKSPDHDTMLHWTTAIARRYLGDDLAESYGKRNAVEGEYLVTLTPTKITAQSGIAD